jgi:hypothetical protein
MNSAGEYVWKDDRFTQRTCCITLECIQRRRFPRTEGIQVGQFRPADHFNLLTLPSLISHQCLSVLSWLIIPLSSHLLHLSLFYMNIVHIYSCSFVKCSKIYEAKPSQFISRHTQMCDNLRKTGTKGNGTVWKPCASWVNRVKNLETKWSLGSINHNKITWKLQT